MNRRTIFHEATSILRRGLGDKNAKNYYVQNGSQRRLAITDIHGSFQTFSKLLEKIKLEKKDQLFILGDSINRAPYSLYVLELIAELICNGFKIYPLRGNHEHLFLEFQKSDTPKLNMMAKRQYSEHVLEDGEIPKAIRKFIQSWPYYYETESELLVHAGFQTDTQNPLESWHDMLWIREFKYDSKKLKGKRVIHGHVPTSIELIEEAVALKANVIKLDNGCIRAGIKGFGSLLCLDLDKMELTKKKNIDFVPA